MGGQHSSCQTKGKYLLGLLKSVAFHNRWSSTLVLLFLFSPVLSCLWKGRLGGCESPCFFCTLMTFTCTGMHFLACTAFSHLPTFSCLFLPVYLFHVHSGLLVHQAQRATKPAIIDRSPHTHIIDATAKPLDGPPGCSSEKDF